MIVVDRLGDPSISQRLDRLLNLGDCFAYALASHTGQPLLFKGADFAQTDLTPAVPEID